MWCVVACQGRAGSVSFSSLIILSCVSLDSLISSSLSSLSPFFLSSFFLLLPRRLCHRLCMLSGRIPGLQIKVC